MNRFNKLIAIVLLVVSSTPVLAETKPSPKTVNYLTQYFDNCESLWPDFKQLILPYYVRLRWLLLVEHKQYNMTGDIAKFVDQKTNTMLTIALTRVNNTNPFVQGETPTCNQLSDFAAVSNVLSHYINIFEQELFVIQN